jgi:hypothetical protein
MIRLETGGFFVYGFLKTTIAVMYGMELFEEYLAFYEQRKVE